MVIGRFLSILGSTLVLAGCVGNPLSPTVMQAAPPEIYPERGEVTRGDEYRIGPFDELSIVVFQEPDLSQAKVPVDANGDIQFPLIGLVEASGKTSGELSEEIEQRLSVRHLVNPDVIVSVSNAASQVVTVEGQVERPGRYEIKGTMGLLTALASAQGPTETAKLDEVLVFRTIDDKKYIARFDLRAIRGGWSPDPVIKGNDIVVVGASSAKALFRDVLTALPGLGSIFIALEQSTN